MKPGTTIHSGMIPYLSTFFTDSWSLDCSARGVTEWVASLQGNPAVVIMRVAFILFLLQFYIESNRYRSPSTRSSTSRFRSQRWRKRRLCGSGHWILFWNHSRLVIAEFIRLFRCLLTARVSGIVGYPHVLFAWFVSGARCMMVENAGRILLLFAQQKFMLGPATIIIPLYAGNKNALPAFHM